MITLVNPTNEIMIGMYAGVEYEFSPWGVDGCKRQMSDKCGNHILNKLQARGMTVLDYADNTADGGKKEKKKIADGQKRNKAFKEKQIIRYNADNEARKMGGMAYIDPPDQIKQYSEDLGMRLEKPYTAPDSDKNEIRELKEDKKKTENMLAAALEKMEAIVKAVSAKGVELEVPKTPEDEKKVAKDLKKVYHYMQRGEFEDWVNKIEPVVYYSYPQEAQDGIRAKFEKLWPEGGGDDKVFPIA